MNQVILVGRLTAPAEVVEIDGAKKVTTITIAVSRGFKNSDGIYEADFIKCILWNNMAVNTQNYCNKGDCIGVKGRLQTRTYENENKEKKYITEVIAEKITFLSSVKQKDEKIENKKELVDKK